MFQAEGTSGAIARTSQRLGIMGEWEEEMKPDSKLVTALPILRNSALLKEKRERNYGRFLKSE